MINASEDLQRAIDYITAESSSDIRAATGVMSSTDINATMRFIEKQLTLLYEKTRILEDIRDYSLAFIAREVSQARKLMTEKATLLEERIDSFASIGSTTAIPTFNGANSQAAARNGEVIPIAKKRSGYIIPASETLMNCTISSMDKESDSACYKDNKNEATDADYRSLYYTDKAGTIQESVTVHLSMVETVNMIDILPVGCKISQITAIDDAGTENKLMRLPYFNEFSVKSIRFDITSDEAESASVNVGTLSPDESSLWENTAQDTDTKETMSNREESTTKKSLTQQWTEVTL